MRESKVAIGGSQRFTLPRDVRATIIPAGHTAVLPAGERVTLVQALGGTATVTTREGEMARLTREDSVDFGFVQPSQEGDGGEAPIGEFSIEAVWEAAATVYDPEIPVDIVELGLVYRIEPSDLPSGNKRVDIDMSVTAPFCGMGDILRRDLHDAVAALPGVEVVEVVLVFDPPWDASRLSDVARLELGMM
ncbi:iron-sulfur cluster assembly protein [Rhabdothermincola salaria]|uniref:iron-sulfur cluster assembly protein n=1 Tax=Rhabdothermincola salaria TaxID=2903142 RepID=UPI001E42FA81|nr:iron-sulfur cluster assembly protein [Rhabdothermincola salaria]MCD9622831.1 iron-sulfur cluster assembly protein [Rhabdothermincola salaria]